MSSSVLEKKGKVVTWSSKLSSIVSSGNKSIIRSLLEKQTLRRLQEVGGQENVFIAEMGSEPN